MSPEKPLGRADLFCQEVADGFVLFDPQAEKAYVLNASAAFVWTCCDGHHSREAIVEELADSLGDKAPAREQLRSDVDRALEDFRNQGLLGEA